MRATGSESLLLARYGQNNPAIALGRKSWLFAGSERGADRAAAMTTLIMMAKLNDVDPQVRRHGWPMCSAKSLTSRRAGLPNYCRGIGSNQICERPP